MAKARELQLGGRAAWGLWACLGFTTLVGGGLVWQAVTEPHAAAAWMIWGAAASCIGLSVLGSYTLSRRSSIFVEHGTLVARTPFSVRKLALSEVNRLQLRQRRTPLGSAYRELVVIDHGGMSRAVILANDFSDSRIAHFANAAGLRFKPD